MAKIAKGKSSSKSRSRQLPVIAAVLVIVGVLYLGTTWLGKNVMWDEHFNITIHNDTSMAVGLTNIDIPKGVSPDQAITLQPGAVVQVDFSNDSSRDFAITDANGSQLGCLPFGFWGTPPVGHRTAEVSSMQPCPGKVSTQLH